LGGLLLGVKQAKIPPERLFPGYKTGLKPPKERPLLGVNRLKTSQERPPLGVKQG